MDLLGSIMGTMDKAKPAPPSEKEKQLKKKQKVGSWSHLEMELTVDYRRSSRPNWRRSIKRPN